MLKHVLKNVKLKNLESVAKNRSCYSLSISILNKAKVLKPNLKAQNVLDNCYRFTASNAKLFYDYENAYAFNIINKESLNKNTLISGNKVNALEEFNNILSQNWRESSATEIVKAFKSVKNYCIQNEINISDTRFDNLVDGLMDHCENLTDTEIIELLVCLSEYPLCDSYTSHNFHDVWSCLDDICCWKMLDWNLDKMFIVANIWYTLRLVDFEYEYALEKQINNMSVDEMAVVAMGYFKTRTKIKLMPILESMAQRVSENSKTIHEISLTAIAKIIRHSKPGKLVPQVHSMLDKLYEELDRLSNLSCLHVALIGTGLQTPHKKTLQKVSEKIVKDISIVEKVRFKDIERLLNVLSMFDFDPKTEPDVYKAAYIELHRNERLEELILYPRCLPSALNYLSLRNIYSHELMNRILDIEYINGIYGKGSKYLPRDLFSLNASIDIECPEYTGNRLPVQLKYKAAKWLTDFIPTYDQHTKITATDKLILDIIDRVKDIVKDEKLIYVDHVLPHFSRADIILCKDKKSGKFVQPLGFENYVLGDVMFPINDGSLEWFAIVIVGWNNTIRESSLPLGNMIMKKRHLEKVGYHPVFVIWNEFLRLSKEDQINYIFKKLD
ncbi:hypothetical protein NQ314_003166 [Rhamnusium bicolor]|uniref:RAP domain-containing protein n=1 Tax=Rhamnusium bicolor TaxID=1586634 RepID=A0AAV8ZPI3_9CUCU|nr:hypothetical protein NQ314_003166 [Rhamnusium bicolor]